jgi:ParB/RepB/Spo0J family partition protein
MEEKRREVVYLDITKVKPNEWNPNTQTESVFNALTENIQEIGMTEPIMVKPEEDGTFLLVSGHHRWEACKVLGHTEIPAYVMEDFDEDAAKFQTVRMNMLKGKLDPVKFTKLFDDMADKYGKDLTKQMMALVDEKAFQNLYVNVKKELPKELRDKMDKARGDMKTVDDLSRILNEMFSKYGDTLKHNFMVFQYGGKTHLWVMMNDKLKKKLIDQTLEEIKSGNYDIAQYFMKLITEHGDDVMSELEPIGQEENIFAEESDGSADISDNDSEDYVS